jgi:hypothetical protein
MRSLPRPKNMPTRRDVTGLNSSVQTGRTSRLRDRFRLRIGNSDGQGVLCYAA